MKCNVRNFFRNKLENTPPFQGSNRAEKPYRAKKSGEEN